MPLDVSKKPPYFEERCLYRLLLMLCPKFGKAAKKYVSHGTYCYIQIGNIRYPLYEDEWEYMKQLYEWKF